MRLIDITGQVFGRLKVVRKAAASCMWECQCACGNTMQTTGTNLRSGNSTSCGCWHREQLVANNSALKSLEPWVADMALYRRKTGYRSNRLQRGVPGSNQFRTREGVRAEHPSLTWTLDLEDYIRLVTGDCHYCGRAPSQVPKGVGMSAFRRGGIDRVDNSKGYCVSNCVSCCVFCNREKRAQSLSVFIENTRRRYEHLKSKGLIPTT